MKIARLLTPWKGTGTRADPYRPQVAEGKRSRLYSTSQLAQSIAQFPPVRRNEQRFFVGPSVYPGCPYAWRVP
jgi:hypothetical protein